MVESAMKDISADPVRIFHGIDFSGDVKKWKPGCGRSELGQCNVWIATAEAQADALVLVGLRPAQDLRHLRGRERPFERPIQPGDEHPFERLARLLARGDYCAAAIDAPFSVPEPYLPEGGWQALLQDIAALPKENGPFPKGQELVAYAARSVTYAARSVPLAEKQPLRRTESLWKRQGLNVRSTLWNGPGGDGTGRPGAPFAIACLSLLAKAQRPVWPWDRDDPGLLVEAYPAGQLYEWDMHNAERAYTLEQISHRITIPDDLSAHCLRSADALDAVLCLFAAKAAAEGLATVGDPAAAATEGWIAVHPA